ncbi:MAG TPA: hypothetical protein VHJ76_02985 [Actinomycetota bacterium]|nr:hypothetical protein [Actinomycetota bacterium]
MKDKSVLRAAATILALVSVVACAETDGGGERTAPSPAAEPEFVNGGECPPAGHAELPEDAGCVSSVVSDDDRLVVYALLNRTRKPRLWRIRLTTQGHEIDRRLRAGNVTSYPRAVGATDLDSDGRTEWWVKTADYASHGAAWAGLTLFVVDDGALVPVESEGRPLTVNFGGISRLGEGATCRDGDLVVLRVWARDRQNERWWISERRYALDGTRARLLDRRRRSLVIESYADPDLARNYQVNCDGQTFTPFD